MKRSRLLVGASALASAALVGAFLAAGGSSYEPLRVADPCEPREWRDPGGLEERAEQFALSALDGAACELRVSREELARALSTEETRERFAAEQGIGDEELEDAVRAGLRRAIDDSEEAGALHPILAAPLREVAERIPVDEGVALIEDARPVFDDVSGFFDRLELPEIGVPEALEPLLP